ncbi:MAG: MtrB/PioB family outer membrane beta-barrel protein, partial [Betaproteobacteria bacterium]|nr:MtrB/PioB family outer membrane beta-barrel protein [Betaproteobacteria bacterium]
DIKNSNSTWGFGIVGKPNGVLDVGANVTRTYDNTKYTFSQDFQMSANNIAQSAIGLPPVFFSDTRYSLFAKYAVSRQSDLRFDLLYVHNKFEEWSWGYARVPFAYSDNTTVTINPDQHVTFIGGTYIYRF